MGQDAVNYVLQFAEARCWEFYDISFVIHLVRPGLIGGTFPTSKRLNFREF